MKSAKVGTFFRIGTPPILSDESREMKKTSFYPAVLVLVLFFMLPVAESQADIYRYTDEEGVVHLTNVPTNPKFQLWLKEKKNNMVSIGRHFSGRQREYAGYDDLIVKAADRHNIDYALIKAVMKAESGFNHNAVSPKGARGLMQLMPGTADLYRVDDSFDPWSNIDGGARHLKYLLGQYNGNLPLTIAAYNAGEKAVQKYNYRIPPYEETRTYVKRVLQYLRKYNSDSQGYAQVDD